MKERGKEEKEEESPPSSPSLPDHESDLLPVGDMACPALAQESMERRSSDQEAGVDLDTSVDTTRKRRLESPPSSCSVATPPPSPRHLWFPFMCPSLPDHESDLLPVGDMACPALAQESMERRSSDQEAGVDLDTSVDTTRKRRLESPPSSCSVATPPPSPRHLWFPFMCPSLPDHESDLLPVGDMACPALAQESMERRSSDQEAGVDLDTSVDTTRKRRLESPPSSCSVATPPPSPRHLWFPFMCPSLPDHESDLLPVGDMACPALAQESMERRSSDQEAGVDLDTSVDTTRKRRLESPPSSCSVATPPPSPRHLWFPFMCPSLPDHESDLLPVGDMACPALAQESMERRSSDQEARVDADASVDDTSRKRRRRK